MMPGARCQACNKEGIWLDGVIASQKLQEVGFNCSKPSATQLINLEFGCPRMEKETNLLALE